MAEQEPDRPTSSEDAEESPAPRLRDRSWSFGTAVAACLATLLIGGVAGASLGALAASSGDDHRMVRHPGSERGAQPWRGQRPHGHGLDGRGEGQRRDWQRMPRGGPGAGLSEDRRQELRERMRQWREESSRPLPSEGSSPSPAPSPSAGSARRRAR